MFNTHLSAKHLLAKVESYHYKHTCSHIIILGCLSLPENAEVIEDKDGSGLAYRCVDGYELADDGKCEDLNECDLDKAVSFRCGMQHTLGMMSPKTLILFIKLELMFSFQPEIFG